MVDWSQKKLYWNKQLGGDYYRQRRRMLINTTLWNKQRGGATHMGEFIGGWSKIKEVAKWNKQQGGSNMYAGDTSVFFGGCFIVKKVGV